MLCLCKLSSFSLLALALSSVVSARPVVNRSYGVPAPITPRGSIPVTLGGKQIGSNQQGGNFDDFFGNGNFDARLNEVTIVKQQRELVCSSNDLRRVRQQLAVIQEFAKQIILQQICEVEIQTVIIQQLNVQIDNFGRNVRRSGGRNDGGNGGRNNGGNGGRNNNDGPSFDVVIAQKITEITQVISRGGNLGDLDLGFLGSEIGRNSARVGGSNWDDNNSPESVGNAYKAAKDEQKKEQDQDENNQQENDGKNQQEQKTTTAETATATATEAATASTSSAAAEKTAESSAEASATSTKASAAESTTAAQASATETSKAAEGSATETSKATEGSATESSAAATPTATKA